jgi:hypothetical protein
MSIKVLYEKKRYEESTPYFLFPDAPVESARGCLVGSDVVVDNNASMIFLLENVGNFYSKYLFLIPGFLWLFSRSTHELLQHVLFSEARRSDYRFC